MYAYMGLCVLCVCVYVCLCVCVCVCVCKAVIMKCSQYTNNSVKRTGLYWGLSAICCLESVMIFEDVVYQENHTIVI